MKLFFHFLQFPLLTSFLFRILYGLLLLFIPNFCPHLFLQHRPFFPTQLSLSDGSQPPTNSPTSQSISNRVVSLSHKSNTLLLQVSLRLIPPGPTISLLQIQPNPPFYLGPPLPIFNHSTTQLPPILEMPPSIFSPNGNTLIKQNF